MTWWHLCGLQSRAPPVQLSLRLPCPAAPGERIRAPQLHRDGEPGEASEEGRKEPVGTTTPTSGAQHLPALPRGPASPNLWHLPGQHLLLVYDGHQVICQHGHLHAHTVLS